MLMLVKHKTRHTNSPLQKVICLKMFCVLMLQCEMQSDKAVFRVGDRAEKHSPGSAAGLRPVEPHGLSGSGGFC